MHWQARACPRRLAPQLAPVRSGESDPSAKVGLGASRRLLLLVTPLWWWDERCLQRTAATWAILRLGAPSAAAFLFSWPTMGTAPPRSCGELPSRSLTRPKAPPRCKLARPISQILLLVSPTTGQGAPSGQHQSGMTLTLPQAAAARACPEAFCFARWRR
jgi:hypothetical protein